MGLFVIFYWLIKIAIGLGLLYALIKIFAAFRYDVITTEEGFTLKKTVLFFDPYKQSFLFFRYGWLGTLFMLVAVGGLCAWYFYPQPSDGGYLPRNFLCNFLTYLPNFLTHEFSHRFWCPLGNEWICFASGCGAEVGMPVIVYLLFLRLKGGRFFEPFVLYWLASALYSAGLYASDASSSQLSLASADMVSNLAKGTRGDWYYILNPFGLLNYDVLIGNILVAGACISAALAFYSVYYYIFRDDQYPINTL